MDIENPVGDGRTGYLRGEHAKPTAIGKASIIQRNANRWCGCVLLYIYKLF